MVLSKAYEHLWNMHGFVVAKDVLEVLKGSGFEHMLRLAELPRLNICMGLIRYMVDRYDIDSHCFQFPNNVKLYISLEDIFHIWGLPIIGRPLIGLECHGPNICEEIFPNLDLNVFEKSQGFKLGTLKTIATGSEHDLNIRVRATVLYILGSIVVPDATSICVKAFYGSFLQDIHNIRAFAWGEVMLVGIHSALVKYKKKSLKPSGKSPSGIGGSMFTVMIFALLHVKNLKQQLGIHEDFSSTKWPLIEDWSNEVQKTLKNSSANPDLNQIQEAMTTCTVDNVIWRPYSNLERVPDDYKRNIKQFLAIFPMFKNEVCVIHRPYLAPRQFDIPNELVDRMESWFKSNVRGLKHIEVKGTQGTGIKDYWQIWAKKLKGTVSETRRKVLNQGWLHLSEEDKSVIVQMNDEIASRKWDQNPIVYERRRKKLPSPKETNDEDEGTNARLPSPKVINIEDDGTGGIDVRIDDEDQYMDDDNRGAYSFEEQTNNWSNNEDVADKTGRAHVEAGGSGGTGADDTWRARRNKNKSEMNQTEPNKVPRYVESAQIQSGIHHKHTTKKKLLIFDINGVLADIVHGCTECTTCKPDKLYNNKSVFLRPHFKEFIEFCLEKFQIAIWTSQQWSNAREFTTTFLRDYVLNFVWNYNHCTNMGKQENSQKPLLLKELCYVWKRFKQFDETNTLLIDDSPYKCLRNPEGTTIFLQTYSYINKERDTVLGKDGELRLYLNELANVPSVIDFVRNKRLDQPPLSKEDHASRNLTLV